VITSLIAAQSTGGVAKPDQPGHRCKIDVLQTTRPRSNRQTEAIDWTHDCSDKASGAAMIVICALPRNYRTLDTRRAQQ
jgi:hypothetical protein